MSSVAEGREESEHSDSQQMNMEQLRVRQNEHELIKRIYRRAPLKSRTL